MFPIDEKTLLFFCLTTCFNVSPSPVELSKDEPETMTANLCNERRRLNIMLFFAMVLARRA
jgi:hypothetical protein